MGELSGGGSPRLERLAGAIRASGAGAVAAVARARGVRIAPDAVARTFARCDELPVTTTASMQRDVSAGRPPVPIHAFLVAMLQPQDEAARGVQAG